MKCDLIIPVWNQFDFTKDCVEGILKNTRIPYRLILVDNASGAETQVYLEGLKAKMPDTVELIRNDENLGFIKAVNQALKLSGAPYVCILNNDTVPAPGWLERMVEFAESHEDIGLVNPQCNGHLDMPIEEHAAVLKKNKDEYMEMNQCQGFCMLVKRQLIEKIGVLDEAFGIGGYDDTDYSMRAHLAGYRCAAIKDSYVYHRLHASFNKSGDRDHWVKRNQRLYYEKWGRHLRLGLYASLNKPNERTLSRIALLAYGLAREWSWVHIWLNTKADKNSVRKEVDNMLKKSGLAPHQNIRIDCFDLPKALFSFTLSCKLLERLRKRVRDKRFDALIGFDEKRNGAVPFTAKLLRIPLIDIQLDDSVGDWLVKGKETAILLKKDGKRWTTRAAT